MVENAATCIQVSELYKIMVLVALLELYIISFIVIKDFYCNRDIMLFGGKAPCKYYNRLNIFFI